MEVAGSALPSTSINANISTSTSHYTHMHTAQNASKHTHTHTHTTDTVYVVDLIAASRPGARALVALLRPALTDLGKPKIVHAHGRESFQLSFEFGLQLRPLVDTQAALMLLAGVAGAGAGSGGGSGGGAALAARRLPDVVSTPSLHT